MGGIANSSYSSPSLSANPQIVSTLSDIKNVLLRIEIQGKKSGNKGM